MEGIFLRLWFLVLMSASNLTLRYHKKKITIYQHTRCQDMSPQSQRAIYIHLLFWQFWVTKQNYLLFQKTYLTPEAYMFLNWFLEIILSCKMMK